MDTAGDQEFANLVSQIKDSTVVSASHRGSPRLEKNTSSSAAHDEGPIRNHTTWAVVGDEFYPCETTTPRLPSAQYTIQTSQNRGIYFLRKSIQLDQLLSLPDENMKKVITSIEHFWNREKAFREHGFLWKRGILLWGPPGGGKTSLVQQLSQMIVDRGGISVYSDNPAVDSLGLRLLRKIEPLRPIVVMIEDIDAITQRHGESELLAMLDGELQIDNVVFVATTNYPERLDKRLVNRPSRFDEIIKIGMPTPEARLMYLTKKNPRLLESSAECKRWVDMTHGFSIAHLRELIVSVECLGNDVDESINRLKTMNSIKISSDQAERSSFGFMAE